MRRKSLALLLLAALLTGGCSFAYYNTYFNAKHYYKEAQKLPVRDDGRPAASAVQNYNKAIQKCGIIITEYKETKWIDDALFLLAKCLYHKGSGYVQAAEKFEDLLEYYPDSPFVPESKLYLARCRWGLGKHEDAYRLLQEFLISSDYHELHVLALLLLANWRIEDEDFVRAESLLNQLLEDFPDSEEFEQAYFLLAITYQNQSNFERSNEVFHLLLDSPVSRRTKLDARYHIAWNLHATGSYDESMATCERLVKDEYKESLLPRIQVLIARNHAGQENLDDAVDMLEKVLADAPRTYISAEAAYWLAELHFTVALDYEQAIENYNRVKREKGDSPFVENAVSRSAVASQILQFQNKDRDISAQDLVDEHFKLAEYFLDVLAMPDSALAVYHRVQQQGDRVRAQAAQLDSLLQHSIALPDSVDSLAQVRVDSLRTALAQVRKTSMMFDTMFSPFAQFCELWVHVTEFQDTVSARQILEDMQAASPENRYTVGAEDFLAGREVQFVTVHEQRGMSAYADAIAGLPDDPDAALHQLRAVLTDYNDVMGARTLYALGWVNLYEVGDSTAAALWFDSLLAVAPESEYATQVQRYYIEGQFERLDGLPMLQEGEESPDADSLRSTVLPTRSGPEPITPRDAKFDEFPMVFEEYYPPNPTNRPIFGQVELDVEILIDGSIGAVEIARSYDSSPGGLDQLGLEGVRRWRFGPAMLDGKPVACWIVVPINYGPVLPPE
ncbi:MAG: TonB family protein [Candidatus Cloacimonetes bacterium]|nr:TonB family protein [Candidatus Cloacimonadota bacterium]